MCQPCIYTIHNSLRLAAWATLFQISGSVCDRTHWAQKPVFCAATCLRGCAPAGGRAFLAWARALPLFVSVVMSVPSSSRSVGSPYSVGLRTRHPPSTHWAAPAAAAAAATAAAAAEAPTVAAAPTAAACYPIRQPSRVVISEIARTLTSDAHRAHHPTQQRHFGRAAEASAC